MSEIDDTEELHMGNFPINLKIIEHYQQKYPCLKAKYEMGRYHKVSFCGGKNIYLNLITCEDNIFIPSILQSYVLHWYHTYLFHPGVDRTEVMIRQHLYWPGIRKSVRKEVTNYGTCQRIKWSKEV